MQKYIVTLPTPFQKKGSRGVPQLKRAMLALKSPKLGEFRENKAPNKTYKAMPYKPLHEQGGPTTQLEK